MPIIDGKAVSVACNNDFKKKNSVSYLKSLVYDFAPISFIESLHRKFNPDSVFGFKYKGREISMYLPDHDCIQTNIIVRRRFYELDCLEKMRCYVKPGSVVLDIGGNIGNHTVYFSKICNASFVYSFEPQLDIAKILKENVKLNKLCNKVAVCDFGLGACNSQGSIIFDGKTLNNSGCTMIAPDKSGQLKIMKLDDVYIPERVDFIKIDVEEMEYDVICGAAGLLKRDKPIICIEIIDENYSKVTDKLKEFGYELEKELCELVYIFKYKE